MERFDIDGLFWLVDKPEDKVAGRLRFDPVAGARLGLIGKFNDFIPSGSNPPVRMNAIAGGRFFTLEDCHFERVTRSMLVEGNQGLRGMSISQIYSSLACTGTIANRCNSRMCSYTYDTWSSGCMLCQANQ